MPVKVATAPTSVRPAVSAAISPPMSKSSRCSRTVISPSRHRREERDLARAGNRRIGLHVGLVDRGADNLGVLERIGVFLAASGQVRHQIAARNTDRKSTRLNSSHRCISYAVFCLKKKKKDTTHN